MTLGTNDTALSVGGAVKVELDGFGHSEISIVKSANNQWDSLIVVCFAGILNFRYNKT